MQWLKKLSRKNHGWVERRRHFEKMFADGPLEVIPQKTPVVADTATAETRITHRRGGK